VILTDDMVTRELRAMPRTRKLIAGQGVTFARSFAPFPLCCPSRVSMLTGQYAHNHGVLGNGPTDKFHPEGGFAGFKTDENTLASGVLARRCGIPDDLDRQVPERLRRARKSSTEATGVGPLAWHRGWLVQDFRGVRTGKARRVSRHLPDCLDQSQCRRRHPKVDSKGGAAVPVRLTPGPTQRRAHRS
jgi:hypothetical protein